MPKFTEHFTTAFPTESLGDNKHCSVLLSSSSAFDDIKKENLDLNDKPELKEDPEKLFIISPNGQFLALRTDDQKGIKFISLLDGTLISEIKECHKRPITCLLFINNLQSKGI